MNQQTTKGLFAYDPELEELKRSAQEAYKKLEKARQQTIWLIIDRIIDQLVDCNQIIETTARDCIAGYIIYALVDNNLLKEIAFMPLSADEVIICDMPGKYSLQEYEQLQTIPIWHALNQAIVDLIENQDLKELVKRELIITYIIKQLMQNDVVQ